MNKNYDCNICKKDYKSYMGYWLHNNKYHKDEITTKSELLTNEINCCKYCNKELANRQNRWRHEQKCKLSKPVTLEEQIKYLSE